MFEGKEEGLRKISGGFAVLGLLFGEKAGEGDDVGVDLLLG
jgi:hypothetical protein